jgi:hypothetical protein
LGVRRGRALVQVASADLDVAVLGQYAVAEPAFGDALEPGSMYIVRFNAPLGRGPLRQQALKHPPRNPGHANFQATKSEDRR